VSNNKPTFFRIFSSFSGSFYMKNIRISLNKRLRLASKIIIQNYGEKMMKLSTPKLSGDVYVFKPCKFLPLYVNFKRCLKRHFIYMFLGVSRFRCLRNLERAWKVAFVNFWTCWYLYKTYLSFYNKPLRASRFLGMRARIWHPPCFLRLYIGMDVELIFCYLYLIAY